MARFGRAARVANNNKDTVKVYVVGHNYGVEQMFSANANKNYRCLISDEHDEPDLVVFTGGEDINPKLYGEEPLRETRFNNVRDGVDIEHWKLYTTTPKVGICRGGQFLNVMSGGAMWQHVTEHGSPHLVHNLLQIPGIEEKSLMMTSTHHQMMIPGKEGEVIALAKDHKYGQKKGISNEYRSFLGRDKPEFDTEVVWYPKTNALCFQPHPEYNSYLEGRGYFFKLLNHFFGL